MNTGNVFLVVVLVGLVVAAATFSGIKSRKAKAEEIPEAAEVHAAKIVVIQKRGGGVVVLGVIQVLATIACLFHFIATDTVLQEIAVLLLWVGNGVFWGSFMIVSAISERHTYLVYSDIAVNIDKNVARLESIQEQTNSQRAVAAAIDVGPSRVGTEANTSS